MATENSPASTRRPANAGIFIGYASEDRRFARALAKYLEARGWSVWWDTKILGGQMFAQVISRELAIAWCVIVMWSEKSTESMWVLAEAQEGLQRGILLPIRLDETQNIPVIFKFLETVDLSGWDGRLPDSDGDYHHPGLERVAEAAEAILQSGEAAPLSNSGRDSTDRDAGRVGEGGIEPKQIKRHKYVRVPSGSRLALRVSSDEMNLKVSGGIDGGRARRIWKQEQIFNRTLRTILRSPNRYEVDVRVAFQTSAEAQATVHAAIIRPDGSTHSRPWKSSPLSGKDGEVDFATISINTMASGNR